jgi:hypothetical protein
MSDIVDSRVGYAKEIDGDTFFVVINSETSADPYIVFRMEAGVLFGATSEEYRRVTTPSEEYQAKQRLFVWRQEHGDQLEKIIKSAMGAGAKSLDALALAIDKAGVEPPAWSGEAVAEFMRWRWPFDDPALLFSDDKDQPTAEERRRVFLGGSCGETVKTPASPDLIVPRPGMPAGCVIDLAAVKRAMLREAPASAELADLLIGLAKDNPWFAELLVKLVP